MNKESLAKSNFDQAVASWIDYLNQVRINNLLSELKNQKMNFNEANNIIDAALNDIKNKVVETNRGGDKGMHGFIAEIAECGIGNAREKIIGKEIIYKWINDNSPEDLIKNGIKIQQKFVNSGGNLSLQAIKQHLEKYPNYINSEGKYQIPKDHYEKVIKLLNISEEQANKLASDNEFSLKQWKRINTFFNSNDIDIHDIEPSVNDYSEVQKNTIEKTLFKEKKSLENINDGINDKHYQNSKPNINEGAKATVAAASLEAGTTFVIEIRKKLKNGRKISDLTEDEWIEILKKSGFSFGKGAVRGSSIYILTNFTATPASVANAIATSSFGVADLVYKFKNEDLSENELYENSQILCLEATLCALSALLGQTLIPVPVIGAVIGNSLGTLLYNSVKNNYDSNTEKLLLEYSKSFKVLDESIAKDYKNLVKKLDSNFEIYLSLIENSFSPDIELAFKSSSELALKSGVNPSDILDTKEKINNYFLD